MRQYVMAEKVFNEYERWLTMRALDAGDSGAFSSIVLTSSFSCSQTEATPAPAPVTRAVGHSNGRIRVSWSEADDSMCLDVPFT